MAHIRGQGTQHKGTGHIGAALQIVSAGVRQQEAVGLQRCIRLGRGRIMDDCAVGTVAHNGIKAGSKIMLHFPSELLQLFRRRDFRNGLLAHMVMEPLHKPCQRYAVLDMRKPLVFTLHRILHRLGTHRGIGMLNERYRCGNALQNRIVELAGVYQDATVSRNFTNILIQLQIGAQGNAVFLQRAPELRTKLPLIGIQHQRILGQNQITQHHRAACHIVAPDIQQPAEIVQRGQHKGVRPQLFYILSQGSQLVLTAPRRVPETSADDSPKFRPPDPGQTAALHRHSLQFQP